MAFGKPGRPRENREQRRVEIYRRAAPLILDRGARLTMREAASAACVSVGCLYHYFPAKRDLLLYGLDRAAHTYLCRPFPQRHSALRSADPPSYREAFLGHQVEMALFVRPSVRAAADMGLPTLAASVEATVNHAAREFAGMVAEFVPAAGDAELERLARGIRRSVIGALFDQSITRGEIKATLHALIDGTALAGIGMGDRQSGHPRLSRGMGPADRRESPALGPRPPAGVDDTRGRVGTG